MPKATLQSKWRVGVPIAFTVLGGILFGILVVRKFGDEALENATQVSEKSEIARRVSTPKAAADVPKITTHQRRLTEGAVLHHAAAPGRLPSDRKASVIAEGIGRRDAIESENAFMARLREMWMVQPEVALRMADEGGHRFKDISIRCGVRLDGSPRNGRNGRLCICRREIRGDGGDLSRHPVGHGCSTPHAESPAERIEPIRLSRHTAAAAKQRRATT
jgi:hypothetical protein